MKKWIELVPLYDAPDRDDMVRLDLNEYPYPPPPRVVEAAAEELWRANRYPGRRLYDKLLIGLEHYVDVPKEFIVLGPGAGSLIKALFELGTGPGGVVAYPFPSFSLYEAYALLSNARPEEIRLEEVDYQWQLDFDELLAAARKADIVVIDNPNDPTGSLLLDEKKVIELVHETKGLVVIDEAYYEYSGFTLVKLVESFENLVVVRSFSKAFGLAGLRVGYAVAPKKAASLLRRILGPFPLDRAAAAAAAAALEDPGYVEKHVQWIREQREQLSFQLTLMGMKPYRSWANFLLVDTGVPGIAERLAERGIAVKRVPLGPSYARITIGAPHELRLLLSVLDEIRGGGIPVQPVPQV